MLASFAGGGSSATYEYNHQGVRFKKVANGITHQFINDGSRILGEDRSDNQHMRYFYDAAGIAGFRFANENYRYVRDALGNVVKIYHLSHHADGTSSGQNNRVEERLVAEYDYDANGNISIRAYDSNGNRMNNAPNDHIAQRNPFRWKSYYWDAESRLYYINGRYYDPQMGHFLDAETPEMLFSNIFALGGLDRTAITLYNLLSVLPNRDSIFTAMALAVDPYDPNANRSWWSVHWRNRCCGSL